MDLGTGTELNRTLSEVVLYPPHLPRVATPLYTRSHHHLVVELDLPCRVCGIRNSDLSDPDRAADEKLNYRKASQNETHHWLIEDSLANAVDLGKFNAIALPELYRLFGDPRYQVDFTEGSMLEWIHGDPDALWVLCDVDHRHVQIGIHAITGPIWGVQPYLKDGYDLTGFKAYSPSEAAALTALPGTIGKAAADFATEADQ